MQRFHAATVLTASAMLLGACMPQPDLPELQLTSGKAVYEPGEIPTLSLKLRLKAGASHGWTVTQLSEGSVFVDELSREGGPDAIHFRETPLGPVRRPVSIADGVRFEANRVATVLAPGDVIEIPVFLEHDIDGGFGWLLIVTVSRRLGGPEILKYALGPGRRTLILGYKPPSSVMPVLSAPVTPRLVSNAVTFEQH